MKSIMGSAIADADRGLWFGLKMNVNLALRCVLIAAI